MNASNTGEQSAMAEMAAETVLAFAHPDDFGRPDVLTSFTTIKAVFGMTSRANDPTAALIIPPNEAVALAARVDAARASLSLWRARDRVRLLHVGIVMCLNVGAEPESGEFAGFTGGDLSGATPARVECWIDVNTPGMPARRMEDAVGRALVAAYTRLQPKGTVKPVRDNIPTSEHIRKLAQSLRKSAGKDGDRVLLHYNGHGVPYPTRGGEFWALSPDLNQYIPVHARDLAGWMGGPSMYVLDAHHAGRLIPALLAKRTGAAPLDTSSAPSSGSVPGAGIGSTAAEQDPLDPFVLASCGPDDTLPSHPSLPSDLFTACLTAPIKTALIWALHAGMAGVVLPRAFRHLLDRLPGKLPDRKSPLGELNWLLVAITDTIAWTLMPRALFMRLFRQDMLVAILWRNFLLADRILRQAGCTPASHPSLPGTHDHPLWSHWDNAVTSVLAQLPAMLGYTPFDMQRLEVIGQGLGAGLVRPSNAVAVAQAWGSDGLQGDPFTEAPAGQGAGTAGLAGVGSVAVAETGGGGGGGEPVAGAAPGTAVAMSKQLKRSSSGGIPGGAGPAAQAPSAQPGPSTDSLQAALPGTGLLALSVGVGSTLPAISAPGLPAQSKQWAVMYHALEGGGQDPLAMSLPPAASATARQRVRFLRHRLRHVQPTVVTGLAPPPPPPVARSFGLGGLNPLIHLARPDRPSGVPLPGEYVALDSGPWQGAGPDASAVMHGLSVHAARAGGAPYTYTYAPTTFFTDCLESFEVWLRCASWLALRDSARVADTLVDALAVSSGRPVHMLSRAHGGPGGGGDGATAVGGLSHGHGHGEDAGQVSPRVLEDSGGGVGVGNGDGQSAGLTMGQAAQQAHASTRALAPLLLPVHAGIGLGSGLLPGPLRGTTKDPSMQGTARSAPLPSHPLTVTVAARIRAPDQLPVLLQMVLSGQRRRAVELFARFLDLGPEAVNIALLVGLHSYVMRLLASAADSAREKEKSRELGAGSEVGTQGRGPPSNSPTVAGGVGGIGTDTTLPLGAMTGATVLIVAKLLALECTRTAAEEMVQKFSAIPFVAAYIHGQASSREMQVQARAAAIAADRVRDGGGAHVGREGQDGRGVGTGGVTSPDTVPAVPAGTPSLGTAALQVEAEVRDPTLSITADQTGAALFILCKLLSVYPEACAESSVRAHVLSVVARLLSAPHPVAGNSQWALLALSRLLLHEPAASTLHGSPSLHAGSRPVPLPVASAILTGELQDVLPADRTATGPPSFTTAGGKDKEKEEKKDGAWRDMSGSDLHRAALYVPRLTPDVLLRCMAEPEPAVRAAAAVACCQLLSAGSAWAINGLSATGSSSAPGMVEKLAANAADAALCRLALIRCTPHLAGTVVEKNRVKGGGSKATPRFGPAPTPKLGPTGSGPAAHPNPMPEGVGLGLGPQVPGRATAAGTGTLTDMAILAAVELFVPPAFYETEGGIHVAQGHNPQPNFHLQGSKYLRSAWYIAYCVVGACGTGAYPLPLTAARSQAETHLLTQSVKQAAAARSERRRFVLSSLAKRMRRIMVPQSAVVEVPAGVVEAYEQLSASVSKSQEQAAAAAYAYMYMHQQQAGHPGPRVRAISPGPKAGDVLGYDPGLASEMGTESAEDWLLDAAVGLPLEGRPGGETPMAGVGRMRILGGMGMATGTRTGDHSVLFGTGDPRDMASQGDGARRDSDSELVRLPTPLPLSATVPSFSSMMPMPPPIAATGGVKVAGSRAADGAAGGSTPRLGAQAVYGGAVLSQASVYTARLAGMTPSSSRSGLMGVGKRAYSSFDLSSMRGGEGEGGGAVVEGPPPPGLMATLMFEAGQGGGGTGPSDGPAAIPASASGAATRPREDSRGALMAGALTMFGMSGSGSGSVTDTTALAVGGGEDALTRVGRAGSGAGRHGLGLKISTPVSSPMLAAQTLSGQQPSPTVGLGGGTSRVPSALGRSSRTGVAPLPPHAPLAGDGEGGHSLTSHHAARVGHPRTESAGSLPPATGQAEGVSMGPHMAGIGAGGAGVRARAEKASRGVVLALGALDDDLTSLAPLTPMLMRHACVAVCLLPGLSDASPSVRAEACAAVSGLLASHGAHEAGLATVAALSLLDFLTGGHALLSSLHLSLAGVGVTGGVGVGADSSSGVPAAPHGSGVSHSGGTGSPVGPLGRGGGSGLGVHPSPSPRLRPMSSMGEGGGGVPDTPGRRGVNLLKRMVTAFSGRSGMDSEITSPGGVAVHTDAFPGDGGAGGVHPPAVPGPPNGTPPTLGSVEDHPSPNTSATRDIRSLGLGLPEDLLTLSALAECLDHTAAVFADGMGGTRQAQGEGGIGAWKWILEPQGSARSGPASPAGELSSSACRLMGPAGMLYTALWCALLTCTSDPEPVVASVAVRLVRRALYRVVDACAQAGAGTLPKSTPHGGAPGDGKGYGARCASHWSGSYKPPRHAALQLSLTPGVGVEEDVLPGAPKPVASATAADPSGSVHYSYACTRFYRPLLRPVSRSEEEDPLSASSLRHAARQRLLLAGLTEGTLLAATAFDDTTVGALTESSAKVWAGLQVHARMVRGGGEEGAEGGRGGYPAEEWFPSAQQRRQNRLKSSPDPAHGDSDVSTDPTLAVLSALHLPFPPSFARALCMPTPHVPGLLPGTKVLRQPDGSLRLLGPGMSLFPLLAPALTLPQARERVLEGRGGASMSTRPLHGSSAPNGMGPIPSAGSMGVDWSSGRPQARGVRPHAPSDEFPSFGAFSSPYGPVGMEGVPGLDSGTGSHGFLLDMGAGDGPLGGPLDMSRTSANTNPVNGGRSANSSFQGTGAGSFNRQFTSQGLLVSSRGAGTSSGNLIGLPSGGAFLGRENRESSGLFISGSGRSGRLAGATGPGSGSIQGLAYPYPPVYATPAVGPLGMDVGLPLSPALGPTLGLAGSAGGLSSVQLGPTAPGAGCYGSGPMRSTGMGLRPNRSSANFLLGPPASAQSESGLGVVDIDASMGGEGGMSSHARTLSTSQGVTYLPAPVMQGSSAMEGGHVGSGSAPSSSGGAQPPRHAHEPELEVSTDADMEVLARAAASLAPRLSLPLLARIPAAAVKLARSSARRLCQRAVFDTAPHANMTSALLFHPTQDIIFAVGGNDMVSAWDTGAGGCRGRFRVTTGVSIGWGGGWVGVGSGSVGRGQGSGQGHGSGPSGVASGLHTGASGHGGVHACPLWSPLYSATIKGRMKGAVLGGGAGKLAAGMLSPPKLARPASRLNMGMGKPSSSTVSRVSLVSRMPVPFSSPGTHTHEDGVGFEVEDSHAGEGVTGQGGEPTPVPVARRLTASVTSLLWLDEQAGCHLATGCSDGVVHVWAGGDLVRPWLGGDGGGEGGGGEGDQGLTMGRGGGGSLSRTLGKSSSSLPSLGGEYVGYGHAHAYDGPGLVTTFSALPELKASWPHGGGENEERRTARPGTGGEGAGLILHWLPGLGRLVAAGGSLAHLRIWDLHTQRCAYTLNAGLEAGQGITSISSAWPGTHILVCGTSTGAIHVVDTRLASSAVAGAASRTTSAQGPTPPSYRSPVVAVFSEHTRYVTAVAQARAASAYAMVSASIAGDVRFWDLRSSRSVQGVMAHRGGGGHMSGGLTACALHDYAPLLATGSALKQSVKVFTNTGEPLTELRYHEGFTGQRIGPVSCVAWHPHRLLLGVGTTDSIVGLYHGK